VTGLRIRDLRASYRAQPVLEGLDLDLPTGTTTAVLGPSGCGKTTLLRIIAGFLRPGAGTVEVGGRVVAGPGVWVPPEARGIGYLAQEGNLFPHLTVAANVVFGLPRRARSGRSRAARAAVDELLDLVGLDPAALRDRRPDQLSGGQQQRVALARTLATGPHTVLLDEPFSSLDASLRVTTRQAVAQALAQTGVTVLLVTHDQAEALSFATQVALMRNGRFAQIGSPATMYEDPADLGIARFLGDAVVLTGHTGPGGVTTALGTHEVRGPAQAGRVEVLVRPEQITLRPAVSSPGPLPEGAAGTITAIEYFGHDALVSVQLRAHPDTTICARVSSGGVLPLETAVQAQVNGAVRVYPTADGEQLLTATGSSPRVITAQA
jgi:iron(III) transport system ATP-binding protein